MYLPPDKVNFFEPRSTMYFFDEELHDETKYCIFLTDFAIYFFIYVPCCTLIPYSKQVRWSLIWRITSLVVSRDCTTTNYMSMK